MILDAYFDESGTHDASGLTAVAGFVAPRDAWQHFFEAAWRAFLGMNDNLPFFHMADFESRRPPYYHKWTNERRIAVITELTGIIKRSATLGVGVAVSRACFDAAATMLKGRLMLREPYHLCAHFAMLEVAHWLHQRGWRESVGYVFEVKPKTTGDLRWGLTALNEAMRQLNQPTTRGPIMFGSKEEVVELQAADFLAYETYKQGLRAARLEERPVRKSMLALLHESSVEYRSVLIGDHMLGKIADVLAARAPAP